jgi:cyclopropane fatty-acyl-phospholipid synthase-like methyltransferase
MKPEQQEYWTRVYQEKAPSDVSWFQPEPEASLRALERFSCGPAQSLIDVGGGASSLVDCLLALGWGDVTVLDIAAPALEASRKRLGPKAENVHWEVADITDWQPPRHYDIWHDRAVFHFLTRSEQRKAYLGALSKGLAPNGLVIMATFALDGPEKCSGLPVQRYDPESLESELGDDFRLIEGWREQHATPWGSVQSFNWCVFRLRE